MRCRSTQRKPGRQQDRKRNFGKADSSCREDGNRSEYESVLSGGEKGEEYEKYEFADMKDSSENKRDLKEGKGAEVKDGVLNLGDEESYVTTPIEQLGNGNAISFDLELNKPSKPGDILFEADPAYGTHDIRVMENGKLGFTRELYDYYFDYELPVGKKVNLKIVSTQQKTELFADGRSVGTAVGKFVHNGQVKKEGIKTLRLRFRLSESDLRQMRLQERSTMLLYRQ